ncbi:MAG: hypothetical protein GX287_05630 [Fusobacteria bacterium]|nr:hypothetical protein [Fusobacteriota bacterium]
MKKLMLSICIVVLFIGCGNKKNDKKLNKNEIEEFFEHEKQYIKKAEDAVETVNKKYENIEKTSKKLENDDF